MSFSRHILFVKTFVVSAERHVYKTLQWDRSTLFHMLWYKLSRNWVMWCVGIKTENMVHHCMQKISQLVVIYVSCWWWTVVNSFEFKTRIRCLQVVAVLTAVSEEIKSRGGSESNTEYFAALVSYIAAALSLLSCFLAPELVLVCRWTFKPEPLLVQLMTDCFDWQMTILDSELDMQSSIAVAYLLSIVIKKSVNLILIFYDLNCVRFDCFSVSEVCSDRRLLVVFIFSYCCFVDKCITSSSSSSSHFDAEFVGYGF